MRLILNRSGYRFKIYNASDPKTVVFKAEIFSDYKKEILKVSDHADSIVGTLSIANFHRFLAVWNRHYRIKSTGDNRIYEMRCLKLWKRHWRIFSNTGNEKYDYYGHNGHRKSIFQNDVQIALVDKKFFNWFNRETYYIDMNGDIDPVFVILVVLSFELNVDNDGSTVTFDLGTFGQAKKCDESWKPKKTT